MCTYKSIVIELLSKCVLIITLHIVFQYGVKIVTQLYYINLFKEKKKPYQPISFTHGHQLLCQKSCKANSYFIELPFHVLLITLDKTFN